MGAAQSSNAKEECTVCQGGDNTEQLRKVAIALKDHNEDAFEHPTATKPYLGLAYLPSNRPLSQQELGRCTWAMLHTTAAFMPERLSKQKQQDLRDFMRTLTALYPMGAVHCLTVTCSRYGYLAYCKVGEAVDVKIPRRQPCQHDEACRWMCRFHNEAHRRVQEQAQERNIKVEVAPMECDDLTRYKERWRSGAADGSCDRKAAEKFRKAMPNPILAWQHSQCPLNRDELGRAVWAFLHTSAAYFPREATDASTFMRTLSRLYPCGYCGDTTRDEMIRTGVHTQTGEQFEMWLCHLHNEVNDRLGRQLTDCTRAVAQWKAL